MSRAVLFLAVPLVLACTKKEEAPAADTSTPAPVAAAAAPAPSTAGKWNVNVMPADKDTTLVSFVLDATNDQNGWKLTFPGRKPYDVKVLSISADSIVTEFGPYPSTLQKGVTVNFVHSNLKVDGNKRTGQAIVHYAKKTADSVVTLRQAGTKQ